MFHRRHEARTTARDVFGGGLIRVEAWGSTGEEILIKAFRVAIGDFGMGLWLAGVSEVRFNFLRFRHGGYLRATVGGRRIYLVNEYAGNRQVLLIRGSRVFAWFRGGLLRVLCWSVLRFTFVMFL